MFVFDRLLLRHKRQGDLAKNSSLPALGSGVGARPD